MATRFFSALIIAAMLVAFGCVGNRTTGVDEGGNAFSCEPGLPYADAPCNISCAPGFAGRHVCNSTGTALTGTCRCVATGNPSTTCTPGENRGLCTLACTTSSGHAGVTQGAMTCTAVHAWECVRSSGACMGSVCQPGVQTSCPCGGSVNGTQACNADGTGYTACVCPTPQPFCSTGQNNGSCNIPCSGGGSQSGMSMCNATHDGWTCVPNPGSACPTPQICYAGQTTGGCNIACSGGGSQSGTLTCNSTRDGWTCVPNPGSTCGGSTSCLPGNLYTTSICASRCSSGSGRQLCLSTGVLEDVCQCTTGGTGGTGGTTSISCTTNGAWVTTGCGLTCPSGTIGQQLCSGGYLQAACQCNSVASSGECADGAGQVWSGCPSAPCGDRAAIRMCVNGRWTNPSTGGPICDCAGDSAPRGRICDPARPPTRNACRLPAGTPACLSGQTTGQQCISGGLEYTGCICVNQS